MDVATVKALAEDIMGQYADSLQGWSFVLDQRPTSRLGQCRYTKREIGLSMYALKACTDDGIKDTILHEVAHALVGSGHGHDAVWKRKAREVGADPTHRAKADNMVENYQRPWRWTGTCPTCQDTWGRDRLTERSRRGMCPKCRNTLNWRKS